MKMTFAADGAESADQCETACGHGLGQSVGLAAAGPPCMDEEVNIRVYPRQSAAKGGL
jgi:hypothetical protein